MIITKTALQLTKRYAAGALCKVDFQNIENTMFYPHYESIAQGQGFNEIRRETVRKYWFKIHNRIVIELFFKKKLNLKQADNCLVHSGIVRKILNEKLTVAYVPLAVEKGKLILSMGETIREVDKESLEVEEGSIISFHGKKAAEIITKEEAEAITRNTKEIIDSFYQNSK